MPRLPNTKAGIFSRIDNFGRDFDKCWQWKGAWGANVTRPYYKVEGTNYLAYRIVFELYYRPLEEGEIVRHTCDNGAFPIGCCNPHHLTVGNHNANMADMRDRQRHGLPHHTVRAIRKLAAEGVTQEEIAKRFGTTRSNVSYIVSRKTYAEVD